MKICSAADKDPSVFFLGLSSRVLHLAAPHYRLLEELLVIAQKYILHNWNKDSPLSITLWYREVFNALPHERLQAVLKGKDDLL